MYIDHRDTAMVARDLTGASYKSHCRQRGATLTELLIGMIVLAIVTTMIIAGWTALQNSQAKTLQSNTNQATARDALARISRELRNAQPRALTESPFVSAGPREIVFYSAFNNPGADMDGTGLGQLRLTRVYLDTAGTQPQKNLYWQRDTDNDGVFTASDRRILLASDVVNNSLPNSAASLSYTAIFTYTWPDGSGGSQTGDSVTGNDLGKISSVRIHLLVDRNLNKPPGPTDLETTITPRNTSPD